MKLTILYDNTVFEKGKGLKSDWGFSCLIKTERKNILFDTGANPKILHNNMKILCINPSNIDKIIISHEHWDHNGGLELFKPFSQKVELYRIIENRSEEISPTLKSLPDNKPTNMPTTRDFVDSAWNTSFPSLM